MPASAYVSPLKLSLRCAAIVVAVLSLVLAPLSAQTDTSLASRTMGKATAPVTVYEMADFQCPICQQFATRVFPTIKQQYINTGKVRWVFINYPLTEIHPNAMAAAEFAVCASRQGKFWPAHDMLYTTHDDWAELKNPAPFFESKMAALGLNRTGMTSCLASPTTDALIRDDINGSIRAGANATPSFYIEGGMIIGLYPLPVYQHVLDSIYTAKHKP